MTGCAAINNPVANGIPVRRVPPELLAESKEGLATIPLTSLRQNPPKDYRLAPDDVLGVWIEGVLGKKDEVPPIHLVTDSKLPPSLGFPIPVRADGTINLPYVPPIKVNGLTIEETQEEIRKAYTVEKKILQPGRERILVSLQAPREYHILVIRGDSGENTAGQSVLGGRTVGFFLGAGGAGTGIRHGQGFSIKLPAYENDVLNALARTGGFPGSDAVNEIVIERGSLTDKDIAADTLQRMPDTLRVGDGNKQIIRIPLRMQPGEKLPFTREDIILKTGDVVYIAPRTQDVYYTAGLIPPGEYPLPRDRDLDVVEAISRIGGIINSGGLNSSNIGGATVNTGFGIPSPSLVTVIRRTADGGQFPICVDMNCALVDARERILIQPRDIIVLQERPQDAVARYITGIINFNIVYRFLTSSRASGIFTFNAP